jgi:hypothetical protein
VQAAYNPAAILFHSVLSWPLHRPHEPEKAIEFFHKVFACFSFLDLVLVTVSHTLKYQ